MVLEPVEVVGRNPEVFGSFVPHHKLNPEHGRLQGSHGLVMVDSRQTHHVLFIPGDRRNVVESQLLKTALKNELFMLWFYTLLCLGVESYMTLGVKEQKVGFNLSLFSFLLDENK